MSCTASSLMATAAANGYYGLEDRSLKMGILAMLCAGGAGAGQVVAYTVAPPANPANTSLPAMAYDPTGALSTMGWSVAAQAWV